MATTFEYNPALCHLFQLLLEILINSLNTIIDIKLTTLNLLQYLNFISDSCQVCKVEIQILLFWWDYVCLVYVGMWQISGSSRKWEVLTPLAPSDQTCQLVQCSGVAGTRPHTGQWGQIFENHLVHLLRKLDSYWVNNGIMLIVNSSFGATQFTALDWEFIQVGNKKTLLPPAWSINQVYNIQLISCCSGC